MRSRRGFRELRDRSQLIFENIAPENFYVYPGLKFKTFEYAWGGKNYQPMEPIRNEKGETVKYRVDTTGHKEYKPGEKLLVKGIDYDSTNFTKEE